MRGKMATFWIFIGLILFTSFIPASVMAGNTIKIGIVDCYTGPAAVYTKQALAAFEMAVNEINKKGGVLGKKIEFVTRDDKFKVDLALTYAKELHMREEVDLLAGNISSSNILAISDYCKKNKVPWIPWAGGSDKITGEQGHRYVIQTAINTAMAGRAGAIGLSKKPFKKYWIAGDDYAYGHDVGDGAWNHLMKIKPGVELMGQSWWKVGESDFTPYITAIMAAKPDAIIAATGGMSMAPFMKAAKATGLSDKIPVWIHTSIDHTSVKPLGKDGPAGMFGTNNYLFYYPDTPANKKFADDFLRATGDHPGWFALAGNITAHVIAEGFKKAGSVDREKFIDAVEGIVIDSPTGPVKIREYDHQIIQPVFWGVTTFVPQYDFMIAKDIVAFSGEELATPIEEIKKAREKAGK